MSDSVEKKGTSSSQVPTGSRRTYDVNFKLMVIKYKWLLSQDGNAKWWSEGALVSRTILHLFSD
ncbi:hypothetical protein C0J52_05722 [Blattella germanica]|nr:hypothetical protein C0J52_05722 [Blattella germanica]